MQTRLRGPDHKKGFRTCSCIIVPIKSLYERQTKVPSLQTCVTSGRSPGNYAFSLSNEMVPPKQREIANLLRNETQGPSQVLQNDIVMDLVSWSQT